MTRLTGTFPIDRRSLLAAGGIGLGIGALGFSGCAEARPKGRFAVEKSRAEWKRILTPAEFRVLREAGTERPFSSPLDKEKREGIYRCAGCGNRLYSSAAKYDSGTGWPSFWRPLKGAVGTSTDHLLGYPRTEVHCARCGGHLGHVFGDGPEPTGKRYCMNGVAMDFVPA